ncbi:MAG: hypothetical protein QW328_07805 [Nitrososphaerota archaeon]
MTEYRTRARVDFVRPLQILRKTMDEILDLREGIDAIGKIV